MSTSSNPKPSKPQLALSRAQTAEALGVSAITVDRLVKRGLLKPSRATRRPLFPVWEIERFLRETTGEVLA
jgi:predicted site-specific integrase-resolvase